MKEYKLYRQENSPKDSFLAENLVKELIAQGKSIAVAEGCTGGNILNKLTIPGSTNVFRMGTVAYSRQAKEDIGIRRETLNKYGEYSPEVALEMAKAVRRLRNDSIGIAAVGEVGSNAQSAWVHLGYSLENGQIFTQSLLIENKNKPYNKSLVANIAIVNSLLSITKGKINFGEGKKLLLPSITEPFKTNKLLDLTNELVNFLRLNQFTISTIESCTGGAIADVITNISGASLVFDRGWVTYDENSKIMLGVPESTLAFGQVYSPQVSEEMAKALKRKTNTDIVISTTGTMDNWDIRPYHTDTPPGTIYYSMIIGNRIITKSLRIKPKRRDLMKKEIVEIIFSDILSIFYTSHNLYFRTYNGKI